MSSTQKGYHCFELRKNSVGGRGLRIHPSLQVSVHLCWSFWVERSNDQLHPVAKEKGKKLQQTNQKSHLYYRSYATPDSVPDPDPEPVHPNTPKIVTGELFYIYLRCKLNVLDMKIELCGCQITMQSCWQMNMFTLQRSWHLIRQILSSAQPPPWPLSKKRMTLKKENKQTLMKGTNGR